MKYKSEIINDILEQRGHEKSSLHYQSECVETWINEVKGAYPKLCDYESEWLNYIEENPIGEFPYESITDVTDATVNNVVPLAYKSAILSGQTLVNLYPQSEFDALYASRAQVERGYRYTQTQHHDATRIEITSLKNGRFKTNTTYYVKFTTKVNKARICEVRFEGGQSSTITLSANETKVIKAKISSGQTLQRFFIYFKPSDGSDYVGDTFDILDFVVLEYQDGMENWDIPYFEGMQSVKLPVLTTTGKNLLNMNNITLGSYVSGGGGYGSQVSFTNDAKRAYITIPVKPNTKYSYKSNIIYGYLRCMKNLAVEAGHISRNSLTHTITTTEETNYISINLRHTDETVQQLTREMIDSAEIMFVEGEDASSYEPFKSNILSCNEDVELGSVGEVKDELNLLTKQLTQRTETRPYQEGDELNSEVVTDMTNTRYKLAQEVVKTVDLTITNQGGEQLTTIKPLEGTMHISTDGTPLKPSISMEIPVEAITQNLYSFIEEE